MASMHRVSARALAALAAGLLPVLAHAQPVTFAGETAVGGVGTSIGFFDVMLPAAGAALGFTNISIDVNHNGFIEPAEWVVQNSAVGLNSSDFGSINGVHMSYTFNDSGLGIAPGGYNVYTSYSSSPGGAPGPGSGALVNPVVWGQYDYGSLIGGASGMDLGAMTRRANGPMSGRAFGPQPSQGRGGPGANDDIIGRVRHDIPGILQGKNECAPTSAAQSLLWMQARGQAIGTLPATANMLNQLKSDMNSTWVAGQYPGISPANFLPGKIKFVMDNNLSINSVSGGAFDGTGTFDFIKAAIEANKDVEMRIQYPGDGGHWVTIAGWYDDGTTRKLYFKDPLTGGDKVEEYTINGTTIKDYKYGAGAQISFAVAESVAGPGTLVCLGMGGLLAARRRRS